MSLEKQKRRKSATFFVLFFPLIRIRFTQNTQNTRVYFFARESSEGDQRRFSSVRGRSTSQRKRREKDAREKKGDADTRGRRRRDVWRSRCDESNAKSLRRDDTFGESKQRRDASTTTTTTTRRWWRTVRERREWKSIGEREWRRTVWKRIGKSRRRRRRVVWEHRQRRSIRDWHSTTTTTTRRWWWWIVRKRVRAILWWWWWWWIVWCGDAERER